MTDVNPPQSFDVEDPGKPDNANPAEESATAEIDEASTDADEGGSGISQAQPTGQEETRSGPRQATTFVYDPNRVTLKFIFANRDGLSVILECKPEDSVGEVKCALLSLWPKEMPECPSGDRIRLICMGKGMLTPDTKSIESFQIPVFKTHPTPVNVSVRPDFVVDIKKGSPRKSVGGPGVSGNNGAGSRAGNGNNASTGCGCVVS